MELGPLRGSRRGSRKPCWSRFSVQAGGHKPGASVGGQPLPPAPQSEEGMGRRESLEGLAGARGRQGPEICPGRRGGRRGIPGSGPSLKPCWRKLQDLPSLTQCPTASYSSSWTPGLPAASASLIHVCDDDNNLLPAQTPRSGGLARRRRDGGSAGREGGREGGGSRLASRWPPPCSLQPLGSAEMKGAGGFPLLNSLVVLEGLV